MDVPILVSHAVPDGPWAQWIAVELRAAGYPVEVHCARSDFADRLTLALSGSDPVIVLLSAEHPGTPADWQRVSAAGGRLILLRVDASAPPLPGSHGLDGLGEDEVRELLHTLVVIRSG
ncbi:hypothetical protein AMIS_13410 [Actinoplanes missouriensis 431]|uniref:TIR domain-containing protein n=1 Tax=Actinoplanes missouriensis (strain ATCC 14538 / DSM 43046 / CBS 188.64 / JCM 3121 / NBRC 102363 / NCIMB 12654 / NRRL B-3342 / UNCC 431) TaxID=512565 RepID=I0H0M4_ACTM4|nr:hypothetical protein AMIS_13410 [Actinoplanes missouriensis 431]